jgi:hypothetical protein
MNNAEFSLLWSLIVPPSIIGLSFLITLWLYWVFSKRGDDL